jgi:polysaccharide biosynthesis/export protein
MKHLIRFLRCSGLPAALALLLAACNTTKGPSFDPRAGADPAGAARLAGMTNATDLEEQAFAGLPRNQVKPEMLQASKDFYRLGPSDSIAVEMLGEAGTQATLTVGPDGKVYYSLLPGTMVWGMTLTEVKENLEKGLKRYLKVPPDISVTLRQANSKTVWVLGNVGTPGLFPLTGPMTVLEALTLAGGALGNAAAPDGVCDLQRSFLMREGKLVPVDFDKLLRGGDMSQNVYLQPNDFLYLRSAVTRNVYVLGAVGLPAVIPYSDQLTLVGAVLSSGGPVEYAHLAQVVIIRGSLTEPRIASVDLKQIMKGQAPDVRLQPGDIVHVPFVPWRKLAIVAEGILNTFVSTVAANQGYRIGYGSVSPVGPVVPIGPTTATPVTPVPSR